MGAVLLVSYQVLPAIGRWQQSMTAPHKILSDLQLKRWLLVHLCLRRLQAEVLRLAETMSANRVWSARKARNGSNAEARFQYETGRSHYGRRLFQSSELSESTQC